MSSDKTQVLLFCGGRGSKTLINELLRRTDVDLTLMVNAYDDGLSTGALRKFIPGMLGPSDFRKNLSYLLDLYSEEQYALQALVEYRLPVDFSDHDLASFRKFIATGQHRYLKEPLCGLFQKLGAPKAEVVRKHLQTFFDYYDNQSDKSPIAFPDCSVGNLAFAGIYLGVGQNFNRTIEALGALANIRAKLVNVSCGEGYTLVGIKQDGELLISEGRIVAEQSAVPILDTFFITETPAEGWENLAAKTIKEKLAWFKAHELHPKMSPEASSALAGADVIIYGGGTQHSSLLPSYRIAHSAIKTSPAKIKAFTVNLGHDHDIQSLDAPALVDKALAYLNDPENKQGCITHILYHNATLLKDSVLFDDATLAKKEYKNAQIVCGNFANPIKQNAHNGYTTIKATLDLLEEATFGEKPSLDIYIDLLKRSAAAEAVIQETIELGLEDVFTSVTLHVPQGSLASEPKLPPYLHVASFEKNQSYIDTQALVSWMGRDKKINYLATLTGDGEYRLKDLLKAITLLQTSSFASALGSRTQSRRQFLKSLRSAYGEGGVLYRLSWFGAFVITALFGIRFGVVFSDPLTGFRVYRRDRLPAEACQCFLKHKNLTSIALMGRLLKANVEIAEIPVNYKTFSGFTQPLWRFRRGIRSLFSFFS